MRINATQIDPRSDPTSPDPATQAVEAFAGDAAVCAVVGHRWTPGKIIVSWLPCAECPGGRSNHNGHLRVSCREPGCSSVWYRPTHAAGAEITGRGS
jgi:hypothetical protein